MARKKFQITTDDYDIENAENAEQERVEPEILPEEKEQSIIKEIKESIIKPEKPDESMIEVIKPEKEQPQEKPKKPSRKSNVVPYNIVREPKDCVGYEGRQKGRTLKKRLISLTEDNEKYLEEERWNRRISSVGQLINDIIKEYRESDKGYILGRPQ